MGNPFTKLKGAFRVIELVGEMDEEEYEEMLDMANEVRSWLEDAPFDPEELGELMAGAHKSVREDLDEGNEDVRIDVKDVTDESGGVVATIITVGDLPNQDEITVEDMDGSIHVDAPQLQEPQTIPVKHDYDVVRDIYKNGILTVYAEQAASEPDEGDDTTGSKGWTDGDGDGDDADTGETGV